MPQTLDLDSDQRYRRNLLLRDWIYVLDQAVIAAQTQIKSIHEDLHDDILNRVSPVCRIPQAGPLSFSVVGFGSLC